MLRQFVMLACLLANSSTLVAWDDCPGGCYVYVPDEYSECSLQGEDSEQWCTGECAIPDFGNGEPYCQYETEQIENNPALDGAFWPKVAMAGSGQNGLLPDICTLHACTWYTDCDCRYINGFPFCVSLSSTRTTDEVYEIILNYDAPCLNDL